MTNTFKHLNWEIQPFHLYSGRISPPTERLLNPEIKVKYKRYLPLLSFTIFFFHIIPLQPSYPRS